MTKVSDIPKIAGLAALGLAFVVLALNLLALAPVTFYTTGSFEPPPTFPSMIESARQEFTAIERLFPLGTADTRAVKLDKLDARHAFGNAWATFLSLFGFSFSLIFAFVMVIFYSGGILEAIGYTIVVLFSAILIPLFGIGLYVFGFLNSATEAYYLIWGLAGLPAGLLGMAGLFANPAHYIVIVIVKPA